MNGNKKDGKSMEEMMQAYWELVDVVKLALDNLYTANEYLGKTGSVCREATRILLSMREDSRRETLVFPSRAIH